MQKKIFTDIDIANQITGQYYVIETIDDEGTLLIIGDDGWREHFRIEIRFLLAEYIGCLTIFSNEFIFRLATEQEAIPIREYIEGTETRKVPVYCIERGISFAFPVSGGPPRERKALKFFIAAWSVEIIVYAKNDLDSILKRCDIDIDLQD